MNYYERTIALVLLVIAMLIGLHFLPTLRCGGWEARRVNMLHDLLPPDTTATEVILPTAEELAHVPLPSASVEDAEEEEVPLPSEPYEAVERIADYSAHRDMLRFYEKLTSGQGVRIAYYGDSFVEGDILTGPLRQMLQAQYGGAGVGYVDMATGMEAFRQTVVHRQKGFEIHAVTDRKFDRSLEGPSQRYFLPVGAESRMSLECAKGAAAVEESSLYFVAPGGVEVTAMVSGDSVPQTFSFAPSDGLQRAVVQGRFRRVEWTICADSLPDTTAFYGATLDGRSGVQLDNFSLRGSGGQTLAQLPVERMKEFTRMRPYDLVVLHFGLNVAGEELAKLRYAGYRKQMAASIARVREVFPGAAVLLVSCSDRAHRREEDGQLETQPGLRTLVVAQHQLAMECRTAFWNLFEAMGGAGSIVRMSGESDDINKDYTHLTHGGGRQLARKFFAAIQASITPETEEQP